MPLTTPSTTSLVIHTLAVGVKPCRRLRRASSVVIRGLVDHTRRKTRGKLANAPGTCFRLKPSFSFPLLPLSIPLNALSCCCIEPPALSIVSEDIVTTGPEDHYT